MLCYRRLIDDDHGVILHRQFGHRARGTSERFHTSRVKNMRAFALLILVGSVKPFNENRSARAEITDPNGYHIELRQWFQPAPKNFNAAHLTRGNTQ